MNVLSLFDGISCGQVALQRTGIPVTRYLASEIEKYPIIVTQRNWPNTVQLGDVVKVRQMAECGMLPQIDLLIGGSPCQGFSNAGKGEGFADPRSRLFFEYVRIKALVKPRWFLLENVKMKKPDMDAISFWLGVEPVFINSADFSAQNRQRYYWTNIPVAPWQDRGILLGDIIEDDYQSERDKSYCIDANSFRVISVDQYFEKSRRQIVFKQREKSHTLRVGGLTSPPDARQAWAQVEIAPSEWRRLTVTECERLQTLPDGYTAGISNTQRYKALGNGWTVDVIAHIFKGIAQ